MTIRVSNIKLLTGAIIIAGYTMMMTASLAGSANVEPAAASVIRSWNAAVTSIEPEDQNFRELLDSYKRNPPGRVVLTPDVRASQKQRRLALIGAIVKSHQQRIRDLQDLATAEAALR
jgi:hypothetical protein